MRTRRIGIGGVLLMGLCLTSRIAMAHSGVDALSFSPRQSQPVNHPIAVQLLTLPLQFDGNKGQLDDHVTFFARRMGYATVLTPTESVMVLSQEDATLPIDDRNEAFIMALTFVPTQFHATTQDGNRPVFDPLLNREPGSISRSGVRMTLEDARPSPLSRGQEQLPDIVDDSIGKGPAQ